MTVSVLPDAPIITHPDLFDEAGTLQPMPARFWSTMPREDRQRFGHHHALYSFPTVELIERLTAILPAATLEIGAGNGGYCKALGIRGTDSYQQIEPQMKAYYDLHGQPVISYGAHVEKLDAKTAIKKYRPSCVLAAWVTHKWDPRRPNIGGNMWGVDEHWILDHVDTYAFIGNSNVHAPKPIFTDLNSQRITSHLVDVIPLDDCSRARGGTDFLCIMTRRRGEY
ncbi:TPA: hypothetical protein QH074_004299 [Enterobacter hormaechei subsp. steigerwaltii]|nr:hypothetical protein [Enterobacter hormaechei subsp. steigerwaltii]